MYDCRVYDKVLSLAEVQKNYEVERSNWELPITTVEQFRMIGSNQIEKIDGEYYHFSPIGSTRSKMTSLSPNPARCRLCRCWVPTVGPIPMVT